MNEDDDSHLLNLDDPPAEWTSPDSEESSLNPNSHNKSIDLPASTRESLQQFMDTHPISDEVICLAEKPSRWRSNIILIIAGVVGTLAFVLVASIMRPLPSNILIFLGVFPLALIAALYSIYRGEHRFFALTNYRLISKPGWGDVLVIPYDKMVSVRMRYNWLMLMYELEIKVLLPDDPRQRRPAVSADPNVKRTRLDYVDSVAQLDKYRQYLDNHIISASGPEDL